MSKDPRDRPSSRALLLSLVGQTDDPITATTTALDAAWRTRSPAQDVNAGHPLTGAAPERRRGRRRRLLAMAAALAIGALAMALLVSSATPAHAVLDRYPAGWCVRDLGSRNGTFVNGQRIWQERALRNCDELRVGAARLVYRSGAPSGAAAPRTEAADPVPDLTRREHDALVQLCRPLLDGDLFTAQASSREIAEALFVTEAAVKQHLLHLYAKFGIHDDGERRRLRLANDAVRREAVSIADLRELS